MTICNSSAHFDDEDHGTPCGRLHKTKAAQESCPYCNEILDALAAVYEESKRRPRVPLCRWGCDRQAVARLEDQGGPAECAGCTRQALRMGRDRSGRPVRRVRGVA